MRANILSLGEIFTRKRASSVTAACSYRYSWHQLTLTGRHVKRDLRHQPSIVRTGGFAEQSRFSTSAWRCKGNDGVLESAAARGAEVSVPTKEKAPKRKPAHLQSATSLRSVAFQAQRSRGFIRGQGKRRFVDPQADTKDITASCSAELYDIPLAKRLLEQEGYEIDPLGTELDSQVIHVQTPNYLIKDPQTGKETPQGPGDVFVFASGCVVAWNVAEQTQKHLVHRVLVAAAEQSHLDKVEIEDFDYLEDPTRPNSRIIGDTIILGTQTRFEEDTTGESQDDSNILRLEADVVLAKIAFSSGFARSTKLAVLENLLSSYFETTRSIPATLSKGSKLKFTRSFILRKTGELLSIRAQLNLYSELTDAMPDIFWDSPTQLGLSDYYDEVGTALDVSVRIQALNEKLNYASEIASVLRERLSEKHSTGLEWLIIFLISVEVGFELLRLWKERSESKNADSTEKLFREWLLSQRSQTQHDRKG